MEPLLDKLEESQNWKDILRASCKYNAIPTSLTGELTILKARSLNKRFEKTYEKDCQKLKYYWGENQLKAFHWILICISAIYNIKIQDFTQNEWRILLDIFKSKQRSVLEYQAAKLLNSKIKKTKCWTQDEQKLLIEIIHQQGDNNRWNQIGRQLYSKSKRTYFRTGKQCRQRWLNHLDPKKKHGGWTKDQDLKLLQLADSENRKWAKIVKSFDGQRTQHMIKNRFKSLIVKQKKTSPQLKKQEKLIQALKQRLKSNSIQKIQQNDSYGSEVSSEQNQDKIQIQNKYQHQVADNTNQKIKNSHADQHKNIQPSNTAIQEQKEEEQRRHQNIDPNISNYFQEMSQNRNPPMCGFKMLSPFCFAYSMGNNLTPTGLTPTYFSPPAFFVSNFAQSVVNFQRFLGNPEQVQNNGKSQ